MNNNFNTEQIEKLNALKAEQARIEADIKLQEKIAKNDIKKADAIERAQNQLDKNLASFNQHELERQSFAEQFAAMAGLVTITKVERELSVTPFTYITLESGEHEDWHGEPITHPVTETKISYRNIEIGVECVDVSSSVFRSRYEYKLSVPESVDGSYTRTYKRPNTVIKKIDEYHNKLDIERAQIKTQSNANKAAADYLEQTTPTGTEIKVDREWMPLKWHDQNGHYIHIATVVLPNKNVIKYKVTYSANETFKLILQSFKDSRIEKIKNDPELLINHLK